MTEQQPTDGANVMNATSDWEVVRTINGRPWSRRQVGWYVLDRSTDFSQLGEYAADYCTVTVPAGRYPVYACRDCGQRWHSLLVPMDCVVKLGSHWNRLQPGESRRHTVNLYAHSVAKDILDGQSVIELLDGVEARELPFEFSGERKVTYGIFADGEQC